MIATNSKMAYNWLMKARHHGISRGPGGSPIYDVEFLGWKANQSDILASIGLIQLKKLPEMDKRRREIVNMYNKGFGYERGGIYLYPLLVSNRKKFLILMARDGIQCSVHFRPLHKMTAYNHLTDLPATKLLGKQMVSLPLFPTMTNKQIHYVIKTALKTNLII